MKNEGKKILDLFDSNKIEEALLLAEKTLLSNPDDVDAHFLLGKIFYKKQDWGKAINQFNKVLEISPDHRNAKSQLDMANAILGYFTPDMFNP